MTRSRSLRSCLLRAGSAVPPTTSTRTCARFALSTCAISGLVATSVLIAASARRTLAWLLTCPNNSGPTLLATGVTTGSGAAAGAAGAASGAPARIRASKSARFALSTSRVLSSPLATGFNPALMASICAPEGLTFGTLVSLRMSPIVASNSSAAARSSGLPW